MPAKPTRQEAWDLLTRYTHTESLRSHALAVEAVMRYFARKRGEDEEKWGIIGLLHDLDYEQYPEEHCQQTKRIMAEEGWPEDYIRSILSHGWGICSEEKPEHPMEKILYAADELTGLITAAALVRPSKSLLDMKPKSVKKKWKQRSFAAGADRELIDRGAAMAGMERDELIAETLEGMKTAAADLGLDGKGAQPDSAAPSPAPAPSKNQG